MARQQKQALQRPGLRGRAGLGQPLLRVAAVGSPGGGGKAGQPQHSRTVQCDPVQAGDCDLQPEALIGQGCGRQIARCIQDGQAGQVGGILGVQRRGQANGPEAKPKQQRVQQTHGSNTF